MRGKADNMAEEKDKRKRSLSSALTRTLLLIVLVILISFLVSVYLVTKSERQKTARQESENVLRTLSSMTNWCPFLGRRLLRWTSAASTMPAML